MAGNIASFFLGQIDAIALTLENIADLAFKRPGTPAAIFCFMLAHGMKVKIFNRILPEIKQYGHHLQGKQLSRVEVVESF
jgi:hypothetical protein